MSDPRRLGLATRAVHGAHRPGARPAAAAPVSPPIHQTSTFAFADAERYAESLSTPDGDFVYTRYGNPTNAALEATVADLEGASAGLATASGMAAVSTVLLALATPGGHVVAGRQLYGGTFSLLGGVAARLGIDATLVDLSDLDAVERALRPATRALYVETIANPTLTVADLPALAGVAADAGVALVVDNTVASPFLCRPIEHGADVVVHSATKYLAGHSDVVAGVALFADAATHRRAWDVLIDVGGSADPFACWLVLRGLRTLGLRVQRHSDSAAVVARALAAHPRVRRVHWPGLPEHPTHGVARRLLDGYGGMLAFDIDGGRAAGRRFVEGTDLARLAPSLGGPETLVSHPASTTHRQYGAGALEAAGIGEGLIRVSVGLEDVDDVVDDLLAALDA